MNQLRSWSLLLVLTSLLMIGCGQHQEGKIAFEQACGSCHLLPDPAQLPKEVWQKYTLPEMASRLGFSINGYDPYEGLAWQDRNLVARTGTYPEQPVISAKEFEALHKYILSQAPDSLEVSEAAESAAALRGFTPEPIHIDQRRAGQTTLLQYDPTDNCFKVGNIAGFLLSVAEGRQDSIAKAYSPVVAWAGAGNEGIVGDIGILAPTQMLEGSVSRIDGDRLSLIQRNLHRPVFLLEEDLNMNGRKEIIICEYGDYTGQLRMIYQTESGEQTSQILLNLPGGICAAAKDMNDDGLMDLLVALGQGDEGVLILYQEENLSFRAERVIRCHSVFGTSWMNVCDLDKDGDEDIILAHGDNADYSPVLKPYHGVRIYLNDGHNGFEESWFYPVHGATRVLAEDFDEDGDVDLAICAYFPDYERQPERSFLYLENGGESLFDYRPQSVPEAKSGRWITADAGDYDGDGDLDILLGSFTHTPTPVPMEIQTIWNESGPDLLLLRNTKEQAVSLR